MKWYPFPKYKPTSNTGECFVLTESHHTAIAAYKYSVEEEDYIWVEECDVNIGIVTHFCIPDPVCEDE